MSEDVKDYVFGCNYFIITKAGEKLHRFLATSSHGERSNEVAHLNSLYAGKAKKEYTKLVLVLKADLTAYKWIISCCSPDAKAAVSEISRWIASFGSLNWIVSDRASHFHKYFIRQISERTKLRIRFKTEYWPWTNGTLERTRKKVHRAARPILSEWRLSRKEFPSIIFCIRQIINQLRLRLLGPDDRENGNAL